MEKIDRRKIKPTCGKCGNEHWTFLPCEKADARNELERTNAIRRASLHVVARPRDGYRPYGDQLGEYDTNGYRRDVKQSDGWRVPPPGGE